MGGGLSARLKRIQASQQPAAKPKKAELPPAGAEGGKIPPPGWTRIKPFLLYRESRYALDFPRDFDLLPLLLRRIAPARRGERGAPEETPEEALRIRKEDLLFLDIETTGLSTGAGTIAFAFGAGTFRGEDFIVRQIFLEDYPGEPDFVDALLSMISGDSVLVSFNGAAFDLGVLRTRCVLSGLRFPERAHVDLLRASRRLWARPLGGAALSLLEAKALGRPREGDLPGSEAPDRYFEFLRSADFERIEPVLDHHRSDIAVLPRLMARIMEVFSSPLTAKDVDGSRLGLCLYALGRPAWEPVLKEAHGGGQEDAGKVLAALYKRERRWEEAVQVWSSLPPSPKILRDIAIAYERRLGMLEQAREVCKTALKMDIDESFRDDMKRRLQRIIESGKRKTIKKGRFPIERKKNIV